MLAQAAPLKPWERARAASGVPPPSAPLAPAPDAPSSSNAANATSASALAPPPLVRPPMPVAGFGTSLYSRPMGYGGGMYGGGGFGTGSWGSAGGYGSSYSPYGASPYGSAFGSAWGQAGGMGLPLGTAGGVLESSFRWVHQLMDNFSRVSYLLGQNFEALRSSFLSFLNLCEGLAPLVGLVQGLTAYRLLRALFRRLVLFLKWVFGYVEDAAPSAGLTAPSSSSSSSWQKEFESAGQQAQTSNATAAAAVARKPAPLLLRAAVGLSVLIGLPLLLARGAAMLLVRMPEAPAAEQTAGLLLAGPGAEMEAAFDFAPESERELGFKRGDTVRVTRADVAPGWAEAELAGRRGLVPLSYLSSK
eukprot:m51a1_g610 hypothetical protein (361) ;mRNA; r:90102-91469